MMMMLTNAIIIVHYNLQENTPFPPPMSCTLMNTLCPQSCAELPKTDTL